MPFEKFEDAEAIDVERRKAIAKSIRIISVEELKKLGKEMFDDPDRPCGKRSFSLSRNIRAPLFTTRPAGEGVDAARGFVLWLPL
jgi:hypothetical protein